MAVRLPWMVPSHQTTLSRIVDPQTMHKKIASTAFDCENALYLECVSTIIVGLLQRFYDIKTRFWLVEQGVVTYGSHVEAFVTGIKIDQSPF